MGTSALMHFTKLETAQACRTVAPIVKSYLPQSIDAAQLLWAISGNESSFGDFCAPRYERAFDVGGIYGDAPQMQALILTFGSAAAYSYGPWQLMFCNAPYTATPQGFNDIGVAAQWSAAFLVHQLQRFGFQTITDIGEIWNAGHPMVTPSAGVAAYVQDLIENYAVPMPTVDGQ